MDALQNNETWKLVDLPSGKKPVGCKWVFAVKFKVDGSLERYKAMLVCKRVYSDIWSELSRNICSSGKDEYSKNFTILGC